jgi:hypothetical protein
MPPNAPSELASRAGYARPMVLHARSRVDLRNGARTYGVLAAIAAIWCAGAGVAHARPPERERDLVVGLAVHLATAAGDSCQREGDSVGCQTFTPFAGADLTAQYWLLDFLGLGARVAGSKDLDGSEGASSEGATWDPEDQWLWRVAAELRFDPPILPSGLWVGAQAGLALLSESQESLDGSSRIREDAESRAAPLFGLALGWDFWLGRSFTLAPELRAELISFGDPPELRPDVQGRDYESSLWLDLALRLSYVF